MENDYLFPGTIDTRSSLGWEWPNRTSACTASRQQLSNQRRLGSLGTDLRAGWQKNSYVEQCGWSLRSSECLFFEVHRIGMKMKRGRSLSNKLLRNLSEDWVTSHSRQMYLWRCPCYEGDCTRFLSVQVEWSGFTAFKQPQNNETDKVHFQTIS